MKCEYPRCHKRARHTVDDYFGEDVFTVELCGEHKAKVEKKRMAARRARKMKKV